MKLNKNESIITIPEDAIIKLTPEDRRFLMDVINQNIQMIQNQMQFKISLFISLAAVYLSLLGILISQRSFSLIAYITIIFLVCGFLLSRTGIEKSLVKYQSETYQKIKGKHFEYLIKGVNRQHIKKINKENIYSEVYKK